MIAAISRGARDRILAHAAASPDREVCGLLLGTPGRIEQAIATANVAADPRLGFEIDPAALIAAHRAARNGGPAVIGHYHSHPSGMAEPSIRDAAGAVPGQLWLIVAGGALAAFEAVEDGPIHQCFRGLCLVEAQSAVA